MKKADRLRWAAARTLRDVGELTALWLEGELASQPGYMANRGPDPETRELVPVLAALNRAGWVTDVSQPGEEPQIGYDGATWAQRAGVSGFAEPGLADWIEAAARAFGLLVLRHNGVSWRDRRAFVPVTIRDGWPVTGFGGRWSRRALNFRYAECGDAAVAQLRAAVQLTVVDPRWGPNDVLWPLLAAECAAWVRRPLHGIVTRRGCAT